MNYKTIMLFIVCVLNNHFVNSQNIYSLTEEKNQHRDTIQLVDNKLILRIISATKIKNNSWYTDILSNIGNNQLLVRGQTWMDKSQPSQWWRISQDGGTHWGPFAKVDSFNPSSLKPNMITLSEGSIIGWEDGWNKNTAYDGHPGESVRHTIICASSMEELIKGNIKTKEVAISLPYMVPLMSDNTQSPPIYVLPTWGKLIEGDYGYLIQAAYPRLVFDKAPRLWTEQKTLAYKYRTCIIYSRDKGSTWNYLSTVASPEQYPLPTQAEGYCEPDLLYLGNGNILCVMRSGGNPGGSMMERYTPLFSCHSTDGGLSWTTPVAIAPFGVNPVLLRMKNGLIVCLSGRPGFFLIFSTDEGKSWSSPYWISKSNGAYFRSSSGYGQLLELEPGKLGVTYDEYCSEGDTTKMVTKFKSFTIEVCN